MTPNRPNHPTEPVSLSREGDRGRHVLNLYKCFGSELGQVVREEKMAAIWSGMIK